MTDEKLKLHIDAVERLEEEKSAIGDDIKDRYSLMKAEGYDTKIVKQIIRLRKMNPDDRKEMESILETYLAALGME